ncbi:MAG TPA: cytochrome c, partial [Verrucomicrobiae bacterium]|nr:cytochrome c [Verrucomicrobiae bacterium]
ASLLLLCFVLNGLAADLDKSDNPTAEFLATGKRWADFVEPDFPFFSSTLDARRLGDGLPADNLTPRGLILNPGNGGWACFDIDLLRFSVLWAGQAVSAMSMAQISYHSPGTKSKEGQNDLPKIIGEPLLANGIYPGWRVGEDFSPSFLTDPRAPCPDPKEVGRGALPPTVGRFNAARSTGSGVCLEYEIAGTLIREWMETRLQNGQTVFQRRFQLQPTQKPLWLMLGRPPISEASGFNVALHLDPPTGENVAELIKQADGLYTVRVHRSGEPINFRVAMGFTSNAQIWRTPRESDSQAVTRWSQTVTTQGSLSSATNAYVVDNIPLPFENPWRRNVRLADLAFFQDGRAAVVTFDGDVWIVFGLKGGLEKIEWRRFASGLHEPQSLAIRDGEIFVFDRNGLWHLRDTDGNGEADVHELFSNASAQTAETREYAQAMKLAPDGSFIIGKAGIQMNTIGKDNGKIMRVSRDGRTATMIGYGFRSPYLGVHPKTGLITASDQQGYYVPTTPLHVVRDQQFYGFLPSIVPKEKYPAPIADPITWIPYPINASGGNQVWLVGAEMGPLNDELIHFGYYRPEIFHVLLNRRTPRLQAAVVSITHDLDFSPFDGAVSPVDHQLYFTGFQIFGTVAKLSSGLGRLRYTGRPSTLPREVAPMDKGILLRFDLELDEKQATDPANFSAERWNLKRTFNYGSPHFKLDGSKGQDALIPSSAYLSKDRKSVFVGIPEMKTAMQMRMGWAMTARNGMKLEQNAYFTPYELARFDPTAEGFGSLEVDLTPRNAATATVAKVSAEEGKRLYELMGCVACHSNDGTIVGKVGPTWKNLFGSEVRLAGGGKALADETYLRESIKEPTAKIVAGFDKSEAGMPSYEGVINDPQIEALILYIKTLR